MDCFLFKNWFFDNSVPEVRKFLRENDLKEKAVLLIDNAPSHPGEEELVSEGIKSQISSTKRNPTVAAYGPGNPGKYKKNLQKRTDW